ncbi:EamA family transporter [Acuticoccus sediminis]|uniref:EamA family transporter n=1 Tax=Acuticoccus sediminis TaxID=2184697 RepID=A0A8B2NWG7_9HYPH|nr:DMT family transporter [Acuticoccus sediminis]RAI03713.1 EamA family transporter [Acuticoccus sediminis]
MMDTAVFLAVLAAALLHAGWNSVIKVGLDRYSSVLLLALAQGALAVPIMPFVPLPSADAIPWIVAAALLHCGYQLFLVQAYTHADLSQAYPMARGTAPLIVTLVSAIWLGAAPTMRELAAILAISGGVLALSLERSGGKPMNRKGLFYALGTACFTASYTLLDGLGARVAGTASGYILWMMALNAVLMAVIAGTMRGRAAFARLPAAGLPGVAAGAMSLGSYWIAVWAFTQAPIALVASLRETSILFAILIAATVMREPVSHKRWAAAVFIALGVVVVRL